MISHVKVRKPESLSGNNSVKQRCHMRQLSTTSLAEAAGGRYDADQCFADVWHVAAAEGFLGAVGGAYFGGWGALIGGVGLGAVGALYTYSADPNCQDGY